MLLRNHWILHYLSSSFWCSFDNEYELRYFTNIKLKLQKMFQDLLFFNLHIKSTVAMKITGTIFVIDQLDASRRCFFLKIFPNWYCHIWSFLFFKSVLESKMIEPLVSWPTFFIDICTYIFEYFWYYAIVRNKDQWFTKIICKHLCTIY